MMSYYLCALCQEFHPKDETLDQDWCRRWDWPIKDRYFLNCGEFKLNKKAYVEWLKT